MTFKLLGAFLGPLFVSSFLLAQTGPVDKATLDKGKRIYLSTCIQCHNRDPNLKGPIGPEIVDAPLEVMTAKVMTGKYPEKLPPGFVPKRKTQAMRPLPKFKNDIPAIWAYVQSIKKKK